MKHIDRNAKILNVSHFDLDGAVCAVLLRSVFNNIESVMLGQYQMDKFFATKDLDAYDYIIMTDISFDNQQVMNRDNLILLDHHSTAVKYHDVKSGKIVVEGNSGCHLVKIFLERMFNTKLTMFDNLVYLANSYDMWLWPDQNYKKAVYMNEIFYYHKDSFLERFSGGDTRFTKKEIEFLRNRMNDFDKYWDTLSFHEFPQINAVFVVSNDYCNDVCHKLMYDDNYDYAFCYIANKKKLSFRSKLPDADLGKVVQELFNGGGHPQSAGLSNVTDVKNVITTLVAKLEAN